MCFVLFVCNVLAGVLRVCLCFPLANANISVGNGLFSFSFNQRRTVEHRGWKNIENRFERAHESPLAPGQE